MDDCNTFSIGLIFHTHKNRETTMQAAHAQGHDDGTRPDRNHIFVFGSNLAGAHSAGAAKVAAELFGAEDGKAIGRAGYSYAIPTLDAAFKVLPLSHIQASVDDFCAYAKASREHFFITRIGCGIAGYDDAQIAPMFAQLLPCGNVSLPHPWLRIIQSE
jgi:hypothetical protein